MTREALGFRPVPCEFGADGRAHVDSRVVAGGKHRSSYWPVAQLDGLHGRYPRHGSFRHELWAAAAESPLL